MSSRSPVLVALTVGLVGWVVLSLGACGYLAVKWGPHFLESDKCMDNGGSWDERNARCGYAEPGK